jgi:hypothetical protein
MAVPAKKEVRKEALFDEEWPHQDYCVVKIKGVRSAFPDLGLAGYEQQQQHIFFGKIFKSFCLRRLTLGLNCCNFH